MDEATAHFREAEKISGKYYQHDFNPVPIASRLYVGRALARERQSEKAGEALGRNRPADPPKFLDEAGLNADESSTFYWQIRALAEEALGRLAPAAESWGRFRTVVTLARSPLSGPVRCFYESSMVDYNLGRLSEKMKNPAAAREHCRKFLDCMKNAGPGIPKIEDAGKRLAGLNLWANRRVKASTLQFIGLAKM